MNTRKRSASRRSRNETLPPPQPQPKRRTSRQGGSGRVGSVGESRPLTQDDIPRIIQGVLQSLTATSDSAPTETTPSPSSGSSTTQRGRNKRGRSRLSPSSSRSAPEPTLDEPGIEQRDSSQSPAAPSPLTNAAASVNSSSPATVTSTSSVVPLMTPGVSHNMNVDDSNSGPSSSTGAAFPHTRKSIQQTLCV